MPGSTAYSYFESFSGKDSASVLSSLPTTIPATLENEWLDFKSGKIKPDDLGKIWSKALGAFSNNEGGTLVFGIQADKDPISKVDAANALALVPDVNRLASTLTELSRFSLDPPLPGIEIKAIPSNGRTTEGFVVCYIPEGAAKPYQSLRAPKPFYLRIGDEAKEIPRSILANLFWPKRSYRAAVELKPVQFPLGYGGFRNGSGDRMHGTPVRVLVRNVGEFSIDSPYVRIEVDAIETFVWDYPATFGGDVVSEVLKVQSLGAVMHPELGAELLLAVVTEKKPRNLSFSFSLYGRDMAPKRVSVDYCEELAKAEFA